MATRVARKSPEKSLSSKIITAAGHIRVHAGAADLLSDIFNDQNIRLPNRQLGKFALAISSSAVSRSRIRDAGTASIAIV